DGIRDFHVTGVQTCALPISPPPATASPPTATATDEDTATPRLRPTSRSVWTTPDASPAAATGTPWSDAVVDRSKARPCPSPPTRSEERRGGRERGDRRATVD